MERLHEEADECKIKLQFFPGNFNSQPPEEADEGV